MCPLTVVWLAGVHRLGAGAWFGVSALALLNRGRFSLHPVGRVVGLFLAAGRVADLWLVLLLSQWRVWLWLLGIRAWR